MVNLASGTNGGLAGNANGLFLSGGTHDSEGCCCCTNCCFKFCGDEYLEAAGFNEDQDIFGIKDDLSYYLQSSTITIGGNPQPGDHDGYCGVEFNFLATIVDELTGARCEDVPGRMYLCIGNHTDINDSCACVCHWHIEVEGCEQDCGEDPQCVWNYNGLEWTKVTDQCNECECVHPDPEDVGGFDVGDHQSACVGINVGPKSFIGGDDCLVALCDGPLCGDCGDFSNAGFTIADPDGSVRCCCAAVQHSGGGGEEDGAGGGGSSGDGGGDGGSSGDGGGDGGSSGDGGGDGGSSGDAGGDGGGSGDGGGDGTETVEGDGSDAGGEGTGSEGFP